MFQALSVFDSSESKQLLIFPEGKVIKSDEEVRKKVRNGATFIAAKATVPIVPVYISRRPRFFSKVIVTFGAPIFISSYALEDKNYLKQCSKDLIDIIYSLNAQS